MNEHVKPTFTYCVFTYLYKTSITWSTEKLTFIHVIFRRKHTVHPSEMFNVHSLNDVWGTNDFSFQHHTEVLPLITTINHGQKE